MSEELAGQREAFMRGHDAGLREGIEYVFTNTYSSIPNKESTIKENVEYLIKKYKQEHQNEK